MDRLEDLKLSGVLHLHPLEFSAFVPEVDSRTPPHACGPLSYSCPAQGSIRNIDLSSFFYFLFSYRGTIIWCMLLS